MWNFSVQLWCGPPTCVLLQITRYTDTFLFGKRHLFANRPKNLKKLSVYGKFYHQEIRWKSFYFTRQNSLKSVQNSLKSAHFWKDFFFFFFYLGFLSRTFTNHRTAGEGGGHFFNSSLPLPPASQAIRH